MCIRDSFTFVCPTELLAFEEKKAEFALRNTVVIGASTDSEFSHWKWLQTPQNQGGIQGVTYPLVVDQSLNISKDYDVLIGADEYDEEGNIVFVGEPKAYRGLFLIDKQGVVRHQLVNDLPLGRSVDEVIRMIDSLQFTEEHGEVCPANWKKGDKALTATQEGISKYLSAVSYTHLDVYKRQLLYLLSQSPLMLVLVVWETLESQQLPM